MSEFNPANSKHIKRMIPHGIDPKRVLKSIKKDYVVYKYLEDYQVEWLIKTLNEKIKIK